MAVTELSRKATVACPFCGTLHRVDLARLPDRPKCGHCGRPVLVDRPVAVTDATAEAVLAGTGVPVVMDCYADWCGPCKIMAPVLDDLAHDRAGEVLVVKLDTDRNPATAQRGLGIWYLYDVVVIAAGDCQDGSGRRVVRWEVAGAAGTTPSERRVADVEDRLMSLEAQVGELAERLDFAERLLAQAKERGS